MAPKSHDALAPREPVPTRWQAVLFALKASLLRLARRLREPPGERPRRLERRPLSTLRPPVAQSRTPLFGNSDEREFALQAGKVHNLRLAARWLNGLIVPAGEVFSFWSNFPRPTRRHQFVAGRELREGCVVPSIGGGLCQLSNALYDVALQAGFEIVERHAHSRQVPGSMAEAGRDATIFWNYIDLRFRPHFDSQLEIRLDQGDLVVRWHALADFRARAPAAAGLSDASALARAPAASCETCGVSACFRNPSASGLARAGFTGWLVDSFTPEFDAWIEAHRHSRDWLFVPLESRRFRLGPYRWHSAGFARVRQAPWTVVRRSIVSRRLASQGAARQRALFEMDKALANAFARQIHPLATHLVVTQNLLPFLWEHGDLGGRTFDVLMTRLPIAELERVLDSAAARHPEQPTLADFRAPRAIAEAEGEALAAARHWITPHSAIAELAGARAVKLHWRVPERARAAGGKWLVFPASTLARKGACEVREIARELGLPVRLCGPDLEGPRFWAGVETERAGRAWLHGARAVVLPAWVEHQPRRLLEAVAARVPVIASEACGLAGLAGVTTVPTGNIDVLREAILQTLEATSALTRPAERTSC